MKRVIFGANAKTYDAEGLKPAIINLFETAIDESKFKGSKFKLLKLQVEKHTRPVEYEAKVYYDIIGDVSKNFSDSSARIDIDVPTNVEISPNYFSDDASTVQYVVRFMEHEFTTNKDQQSDNKAYESYSSRWSTLVEEESKKFGIALRARTYPEPPITSANNGYVDFYAYPKSIVRNDYTVEFDDRHYFGMLSLGEYSEEVKLQRYSNSSMTHPDIDFNSLKSDFVSWLQFVADTMDTVADVLRNHEDIESVLDTISDKLYNKLSQMYSDVSVQHRSEIDNPSYRGAGKVDSYSVITVEADGAEVSTKLVGDIDVSMYSKVLKSVSGKLKRIMQKDTRFSNSGGEL